MKRFVVSLGVVTLVCVPLLAHKTEQSPAADRIITACSSVPEVQLATSEDPLAVVCRSLAEAQNVDPVDTALVIVIALVFTLASIVMFAGATRWDVRKIGLFWICVGLAIIFDRAVLVRWNWTSNSASSAEAITDVARAALLVGGVVFIWSIIGWIVERWLPIPTTMERREVPADV